MEGILLCKIGREIKDGEQENNDKSTINWNSKIWTFDHSINFDEILSLCYENTVHKLKLIEVNVDDGSNILTIQLIKQNFSVRATRSDYLLNLALTLLFKNCTPELLSNIDINSEDCRAKKKINKSTMNDYTHKLYDKLYDLHEINRVNEIAWLDHALPQQFLPKLCGYQKYSVAWLLKREREVESITHFFVELESIDNETKLFKHKYYPFVMTEVPANFELQPGGILADEMGLGKTVEILALIFLNPRPPLNFSYDYDDYIDSEHTTAKRLKRDDLLLCLCLSKSIKNVIECSKCRTLQHISCVSSFDDDHTDDINDLYFCPECWYIMTKDKPVKAKTTFIVSPPAIKRQWLTELQRHAEPNLKVLLYEGIIHSKWISPRQLSNYDIILTDYNVMRSEIKFTDKNVSDRVTRHKNTRMRVHSPLLMVEWWRVCLDEAQLIQSNTSNTTAMVKMLPAINRWAVTGTPIQRGISDLHSLLKFIGFDQLCVPTKIWNNLIDDFIMSTDDLTRKPPLVRYLQKCMWRTSKNKIAHELILPPQTEEVHMITMNNLERLFYREQHAYSTFDFQKNIHLLTGDDRVRHFTTMTLNILLQPFLRLRQCCTISVIGANKGFGSIITQKNFLQPEELHKHLKTVNENECRYALRAIASSYNGIAGVHFIREKYDEAIKTYEKVLRLSKEYNQENVTVDSLLQIHALYNILQAHQTALKYRRPKTLTTETISAYEQRTIDLEWKYLNPYASNLRKVEESFKSLYQNMDKDLNILELISEMFTILIETDNTFQEALMNKIYECHSIFPTNAKLKSTKTINGLLYILKDWFDKYKSMHIKLIKRFDNLKYFIENVKPRGQLEVEIYNKITSFVGDVSDCHLSDIRLEVEKQGDEIVTKRRQIGNRKNNPQTRFCELCHLREKLNQYECYLFNKTIDAETNIMEGLDTASMEMHLFKVVLTYLKSKLIAHTAKFEAGLGYIENMQTLCKRLNKYWIEIEYTVKAYDELDMCRTRLAVTTNSTDISKYKVMPFEVKLIFDELVENLDTEQRNLVAKMARLKYIKHLETAANLTEPCPICQNKLSQEYAVLECGHHICFQCLRTMRRYHTGAKIQCSICRNVQHHKSVYNVTRCGLDLKDVCGNYSSKITNIVSLVLKLKQQTPDVKILIFSQWEHILRAIADALENNKIDYRLKFSNKSMKEFKDSNLGITCMLMRLAEGSKGLNIIEATHVFLVEPILNPSEEVQAIGRVHRFGQTKPTKVHRFIVKNTIEENLYNIVTAGRKAQSHWEFDYTSVESLQNLLKLNNDDEDDIDEITDT